MPLASKTVPPVTLKIRTAVGVGPSLLMSVGIVIAKLVKVSSVTELAVTAPPALGAALLDKSNAIVALPVNPAPDCFGSNATNAIEPELALPVKLRVLKAALTALGLPFTSRPVLVRVSTTLALEPKATSPPVGVKRTVILLLSLSLTLMPLTKDAIPCVAVALLGASKTVGALAAVVDSDVLGSLVSVSPSATVTLSATELAPAVIFKEFKAALTALA